MRENKRGGALSKVQKLKKRLSQSFGKLGKNVRTLRTRKREDAFRNYA